MTCCIGSGCYRWLRSFFGGSWTRGGRSFALVRCWWATRGGLGCGEAAGAGFSGGVVGVEAGLCVDEDEGFAVKVEGLRGVVVSCCSRTR